MVPFSKSVTWPAVKSAIDLHGPCSAGPSILEDSGGNGQEFDLFI